MVIVLIGPMGCGKTTVGVTLAQKLGWQFYDADDFHPEANKSKMGEGFPLDDSDRQPWLDILHGIIELNSRDLIHKTLIYGVVSSTIFQKFLQSFSSDQAQIFSI